MIITAVNVQKSCIKSQPCFHLTHAHESGPTVVTPSPALPTEDTFQDLQWMSENADNVKHMIFPSLSSKGEIH